MHRRTYLRTAAAAAGLVHAPVLPAAAGDSDRRATVADTSDEADESFRPAGSVPVSNDTSTFQAAEAVTTADGEYAFVSKIDGFHVVDVSAPTAPEIVETRTDILAGDGGPLRDILDIKYDADRLLVAAPGNSGGTFDGVVLFDVRDPTDPTITSVYRTNHSVHNSFLDGRYAYLTAGDAIEIVDVAAPQAEQVAEWSLVDHESGYRDLPAGARSVHDLYVQDGRAYVAAWDAGTWLLDVSDPSAPAVIGHVADRTLEELTDLSDRELTLQSVLPPGNAHYVRPSKDGTVLAVGKESWGVRRRDGSVRGGPSGIALWDIEDPSEPAELATIDPPPVPDGEQPTYGGYWTTAHNFDLVGGYLYSSWYRGGVRVHDISDPSDPTEVAAWASRDETSFWTAQVAVPGESLVASSFRHPTDPGEPGGLYVFPDPADHATGVPTTSTPTTGAPTTDATATSASTVSTSTAGAEPAESAEPTAEGGSESATTAGSATNGNGATVDGSGTTTEGAETTAESGPGFGFLAGATALGAGAWRALRGERGEE